MENNLFEEYRRRRIREREIDHKTNCYPRGKRK